MKQATDLIGVLREANQVINPQLYEIAEIGKRSGGGNNRHRRWGYVPKDGQSGKRKYFDGDFGGQHQQPKRFHSDSDGKGYQNRAGGNRFFSMSNAPLSRPPPSYNMNQGQAPVFPSRVCPVTPADQMSRPRPLESRPIYHPHAPAIPVPSHSVY